MVLDLSGTLRFPKLPAPSHGWYVVPDFRWDYELDGPAFDFVNAWARVLYEWCEENGKPALLFVDETNLCIAGQKPPPALVNVVMHGRKLGISYIFATRRWVEIPSKLRSQARDFFCFQQREPTDLAVARERGFDPEAVRQLSVGQFFHVREGFPHFHQSCTTRCSEPGEVNNA